MKRAVVILMVLGILAGGVSQSAWACGGEKSGEVENMSVAEAE